MPQRDLNNMREQYDADILLEANCHTNPFQQFDAWFQDAIQQNIIEPNAMTLATVGHDGQPSARIVLLKSFDKNGFVFYSNYESHKGKQIQENEKVALLFWWQQRQIRIEGAVQKLDRESALQYFHSRPIESQIGATVSLQSSIIESREILDEKYDKAYKAYANKVVPLPDYWGGYLVVPTLFEFWQGRMSRLHDRIQYSLEANQDWKIERLSP